VRLEAVRSHLSFDGNDVISNANIEASVGLDAIKNQDMRCADQIGHGRFASHRFTGVSQLPCNRQAPRKERDRSLKTKRTIRDTRFVCSKVPIAMF
jgi:hypothetical protein